MNKLPTFTRPCATAAASGDLRRKADECHVAVLLAPDEARKIADTIDALKSRVFELESQQEEWLVGIEAWNERAEAAEAALADANEELEMMTSKAATYMRQLREMGEALKAAEPYLSGIEPRTAWHKVRAALSSQPDTKGTEDG
jgi:chromosome segregation ATPase